MGDDGRMNETCSVCKAVGFGNATCSACVRQWVRFGIPQASVEMLLNAIGNRMPDPPCGTLFS
jgi:hypothetical protein